MDNLKLRKYGRQDTWMVLQKENHQEQASVCDGVYGCYIVPTGCGNICMAVSYKEVKHNIDGRRILLHEQSRNNGEHGILENNRPECFGKPDSSWLYQQNDYREKAENQPMHQEPGTHRRDHCRPSRNSSQTPGSGRGEARHDNYGPGRGTSLSKIWDQIHENSVFENLLFTGHSGQKGLMRLPLWPLQKGLTCLPPNKYKKEYHPYNVKKKRAHFVRSGRAQGHEHLRMFYVLSWNFLIKVFLL